MKKQIVVRTSCDTAFIKRLANWDPFDYWDRCIVPGTHKNSFDLPIGEESALPKEELEVVIAATDCPIYNYEITYTFKDSSWGIEGKPIGEAIIMFHGLRNCLHIRDIRD